eukprot:CAMPEP_0198275784 /NCGR_PEP_ID=MMETSP1447-20131203/64961_1 /TAXON_ID=420782 /ORGANISM="Chaetoceros dichaeta, Strain CCMP1751" /LENGTH=185 /DNA_ID=CAMNT_0043970681 /DNA_START=155 /DNA_END=709 /DNA_ORIENTATION=+
MMFVRVFGFGGDDGGGLFGFGHGGLEGAGEEGSAAGEGVVYAASLLAGLYLGGYDWLVLLLVCCCSIVGSCYGIMPLRCWRVCIWGATIGWSCCWFVGGVVVVVAASSEVVTVSFSGFVPFGVKHASHATASCVLSEVHAKHAHVAAVCVAFVADDVVAVAEAVAVAGADTGSSTTSSFVTKSSD